jgi:hypothetical protein
LHYTVWTKSSKGLTIGSYKSAFFADLVAAWILENTVELMLDTTFDGIYRDESILVFNKNKTTDEICDWLETFQEVNKLTASELYNSLSTFGTLLHQLI